MQKSTQLLMQHMLTHIFLKIKLIILFWHEGTGHMFDLNERCISLTVERSLTLFSEMRNISLISYKLFLEPLCFSDSDKYFCKQTLWIHPGQDLQQKKNPAKINMLFKVNRFWAYCKSIKINAAFVF